MTKPSKRGTVGPERQSVEIENGELWKPVSLVIIVVEVQLISQMKAYTLNLIIL